ncbi:unnamed protein product [Arabis nemorensis]|uniref:Uncharacterized protein n=1 Tax=Arabis nemorensis TaxID=586526 RepID=A0A565BF97_9BRAS|nr:unnamed protein product [Arabis nemorensis]
MLTTFSHNSRYRASSRHCSSRANTSSSSSRANRAKAIEVANPEDPTVTAVPQAPPPANRLQGPRLHWSPDLVALFDNAVETLGAGHVSAQAIYGVMNRADVSIEQVVSRLKTVRKITKRGG